MEKVGLSSFLKGRFETTSCRGVLAMLERTLPPDWKAWCQGNHLVVNRVFSIEEGADKGVLCPLLYREVANSLKLLADARTAPLDILERVDVVLFKLVHPRLVVHAITRGKHLVGMSSITSSNGLINHIQAGVQVQEFPPFCQTQ